MQTIRAIFLSAAVLGLSAAVVMAASPADTAKGHGDAISALTHGDFANGSGRGAAVSAAAKTLGAAVSAVARLQGAEKSAAGTAKGQAAAAAGQAKGDAASAAGKARGAAVAAAGKANGE